MFPSTWSWESIETLGETNLTFPRERTQVYILLYTRGFPCSKYDFHWLISDHVTLNKYQKDTFSSNVSIAGCITSCSSHNNHSLNCHSPSGAGSRGKPQTVMVEPLDWTCRAVTGNHLSVHKQNTFGHTQTLFHTNPKP